MNKQEGSHMYKTKQKTKQKETEGKYAGIVLIKLWSAVINSFFYVSFDDYATDTEFAINLGQK